MRRALERHNQGLAQVIPVIVRPCDWQSTPLRGLLAAPRDGKAITTWANFDEAYADVARQVRAVVEKRTNTLAETVGLVEPVVQAHRWRQLAREAGQASVSKPREFVPVVVASPAQTQADGSRDIEIELRRGAITMKVIWPRSATADFADWTRELLR